MTSTDRNDREATAPRRTAYWLRRLLRLDVGNMVKMARQIAREFQRSTPVILADMVWCGVRYNAGYYDYHEFEFHLLNGAERRTYLTRPEANHLTRLLNPAEFRHRLADKVEFNRRFDAFLGREWIDLRGVDAAALRRFAEHHGRVMAKASDALAGAGVELVVAAEVEDWTALHRRLVTDGQHLVEEFIRQHPDMARLHPQSVNTLRVVTYLHDGEVDVLAHVVKAGNRQSVDNFGRSGMYTAVCPDGSTRYPAFDKAGRIFPTHPVTGVDFRAFRIPMWARVLQIADDLARVVPELPYVGWDIAITPDGPVVIEGNYNTGVFQMKPSLTGVKEGLVPAYQAAIGDRWR